MRRLLLLLVAFSVIAVAQEPKVFRIQPVRPVEQLRKEALAAQPPIQVGDFYTPELVELVKLDPTIKLDIRYATKNNFLSTPMYDEGRAFMQKPAAEAVVRANKKLHELGYGLLIHDAYRPWYVTKMFWDATPADKHQYVADPAQGSHHNQGCAVDLTLYDLKTGQAVEMPSLYDEMSERAHANYTGGTEQQTHLRELLRNAMEAEGFKVYEFEWWHFDYKDWKHYPVMNLEFDQVPDPSLHDSAIKPRAISAPDPEYSEEARKKKLSGDGAAWVFVGQDGRVKEAIVKQSIGGGLDEKMVEALRNWKFKPAMYENKPIPYMVVVTVSFRLK